jgi:hypothetical protein
VTFGAGLYGWRTIGFRVFHAIPMDSMTLTLGAELSHPHWADANAAAFPGGTDPGNSPQTISLAWASGMPQIVARVMANGKSGNLAWMGWVAGSFEQVDLKGFGSTVAPNGVTLQDPDGAGPEVGAVKKGLTSYAITAGTQLTFMPVTLKAQISTGRGTAPLAGSMLQFGDIQDLGYWAQLGFYATKQVSLWAIYGASSVDKKDLQSWGNTAGAVLTEATTGLRQANQVYGGMLKFADGGYQFGLEYYQNSTDWLLGNLLTPGGTKNTTAMQVLVSGGYWF